LSKTYRNILCILQTKTEGKAFPKAFPTVLYVGQSGRAAPHGSKAGEKGMGRWARNVPTP